MYKFVYDDGDQTVVHEFKEIACTEIVRKFYHFLLGVSFHQSTIADCLATISEEMGDADYENETSN